MLHVIGWRCKMMELATLPSSKHASPRTRDHVIGDGDGLWSPSRTNPEYMPSVFDIDMSESKVKGIEWFQGSFDFYDRSTALTETLLGPFFQHQSRDLLIVSSYILLSYYPIHGVI